MKCIILAGGSGERLWPLSRDLYSKSLLNLYDSKTMIQNVVELASSVVSEKDIVITTNIRLSDDTKLQLKSNGNNVKVISEPMSKNTAAAVASSLIYLQKKRDEIVVILPVDFQISDINEFYNAIENAKKIAKDNYIVCLGVKPLYPEEGFGYIQVGDSYKTGNKVKKFIEKPLKEDIENYINNEEYYWNCGIYVSKISVLLNAFNKYAPQTCINFSKDMFDENDKIDFSFYENIETNSLDYAVIEKTDNLAFVELSTKWNDYGSWTALYNNSKKDSNGNVIQGNVLENQVKNSFIYSSKELVAVSDIEDAVVVETEDAVLVCDKTRASEVGRLVKHLKNENSETTIIHKTVYRPWGFYTCLNEGKGWLSKMITVLPGHKLSLQSHEHRSEHWVVLEGIATIILDDNRHILNKGQSIDIPVNSKHSLQNHTDMPLKILEVQKGDYISETDIIRYEDMYGRVK